MKRLFLILFIFSSTAFAQESLFIQTIKAFKYLEGNPATEPVMLLCCDFREHFIWEKVDALHTVPGWYSIDGRSWVNSRYCDVLSAKKYWEKNKTVFTAKQCRGARLVRGLEDEGSMYE